MVTFKITYRDKLGCLGSTFALISIVAFKMACRNKSHYLDYNRVDT